MEEFGVGDLAEFDEFDVARPRQKRRDARKKESLAPSLQKCAPHTHSKERETGDVRARAPQATSRHTFAGSRLALLFEFLKRRKTKSRSHWRARTLVNTEQPRTVSRSIGLLGDAPVGYARWRLSGDVAVRDLRLSET